MRLAILAYDRISPFMLSTPLAVFGEPFLASGHHIDICAAAPRLAATGGLTIEAPCTLDTARNADVVILPGWRDADEPVSGDIVTELKDAHRRGAIVVGLCLGAFGLAEAGLLSGRRATTHWAKAESFARRYPEVTLDPGALFVNEGQIVTSAGIASGLDYICSQGYPVSAKPTGSPATLSWRHNARVRSHSSSNAPRSDRRKRPV